jgi:CPA2 family monovalent cation:H+ antiporter-2
MELQLLKDMVLVLALAILVLWVFHKLRIPSVVGFLLTGIITGPHGISLISNVHDVEVIAEIGVILLLFTVGIEFSLKNLIRIRKILLIGGGFQVLATIGAIFLISRYIGNPANESLFIGFLIALSSTAIVLKLLRDKGEIDTAHGRISLGVLIFQDIIIVPMILITPILAGNSTEMGGSLWEILLKFIGVALVIVLGAKYGIPKLLYQVARTQNRELFLLSIIVLAFATAFLTYTAGLSLALGAFMAGLLISESEYSQQALGDVVPFLSLFTSFFFISIGMLLNLQFLVNNIVEILIFTTLVLSVKTFLAGGAAFLLGFPLRTVLIAGFTLSQVGEFSFILSEVGVDEGLLSERNYQLFLSVSVLSMAATPIAIMLAHKAGDRIVKMPIPNFLRNGLIPRPESTIAKIQEHLVIVGYGVNGKNVARAAKYAKIPHVIIELNPDTVRKEREEGEIIYFGDATQEEVLSHANVEEAEIIVVTIPTVSDAKRIIQTARRLNPHIHIIIRTRLVSDMKTMYDLGADEVIPEEFETSVEIFTRVLAKYLIPKDEIERLVAEIRSDGYNVFRSLSIDKPDQESLAETIPEVEIHTIHVCEKAPVVGKKVREVHLTDNYSLTPLALSRGQKVYHIDDLDVEFEENDVLFLLGPTKKMAEISNLFRSPDEDC